MNKVFLGGTVNDTTWRDELIKMLDVDYFNPVVDDWTPEAQANEEFEKTHTCNVHFYLISKEMSGVYSIAEAVESAHKVGKTTILHVYPDGFDSHQIKSLKATMELVRRVGGIAYMDYDLSRSARVLNYSFKE